MRRSSLYYTLGLLTLLVAGIYSCKKVNGINNNTVVETPYSLYFTDTSGTLFVSTDGKNISLVFPADGKPCRAIVTSGDNILWAKDKLYFSDNNGVNFNHSFDSLNSISMFDFGATGIGLTGPGSVAVNGLPIDFNQSMLITPPSWGGRVYAVTYAKELNNGSINYLGIVHSDGQGRPGTWGTDGYDSIIGGVLGAGKLPVNITSLTQLANGYLCGLAYENDAVITASTRANRIRYVRNFYKAAKDENPGDKWREVTSNPDAVTSWPTGHGVNQLPPHLGTPDTSFFTLGHLNNRLIAIDRKGEYGAWYSDDYGANWSKYSGLPAGIPLMCISAPFEQVCLIGTDSAGLYMLNQNTGSWQQSNSGLSNNLVVRNITFKETIYKNGTVKKYVYLATNMGIYQSTDGGMNWIRTIPGNYVGIY